MQIPLPWQKIHGNYTVISGSEPWPGNPDGTGLFIWTKNKRVSRLQVAFGNSAKRKLDLIVQDCTDAESQQWLDSCDNISTGKKQQQCAESYSVAQEEFENFVKYMYKPDHPDAMLVSSLEAGNILTRAFDVKTVLNYLCVLSGAKDDFKFKAEGITKASTSANADAGLEVSCKLWWLSYIPQSLQSPSYHIDSLS